MMESITKLQFQSLALGTILPTGVQPVTLVFGAVDSAFTIAIETNMADPLTALQGNVWLRIDDTDPGLTIPVLGEPVVENTAPVISTAIEQPDAPIAQ
jgi:hypothetical protein